MSTDDSALVGGNEQQPADSGIPQETSPQESGGNPAWSELLDALPGGLHGIVKPHLEKWDKGVEQRFQTVQSRYQPYQPLIEQGRTPEELMQGYQLMQMIATNPRQFYDRMTEHYASEWGLNSGQGQGENDDWDSEPTEDGEPTDPMYQQLQQAQQELAQQQGTIAQYLASQVEQQERAAADAEVEQEFGQIAAKYGELDQKKVNLIVSLALQNNLTVMDAADQVFGLLGAQQQAAAAPKQQVRVVPTTGGVPQQQPLDPTKMAPKDRRSLVASILERNNATQ